MALKYETCSGLFFVDYFNLLALSNLIIILELTLRVISPMVHATDQRQQILSYIIHFNLGQKARAIY